MTGVSETTGNNRWHWMEYRSGGPDADGMYWLEAKLKPRFYLYPTFWAWAIRNRRLTVPEAEEIER